MNSTPAMCSCSAKHACVSVCVCVCVCVCVIFLPRIVFLITIWVTVNTATDLR